MSRYARKKDSNHALIVKYFKSLGCSVLVLDVTVTGAPDLLIGRYGVNRLVEVKTIGEEPRASQEAWWRSWKGGTVQVARTLLDVSRIVQGMVDDE